ncbi:MAG: oligosaccharide flippase family protein [Rhodobacteraceae bacterium]|nr:oligosaccharide flippase family protein [Paracoccaceae bacterium]
MTNSKPGFDLLRNQMAKGALWMVIMRWFMRSLGLISTLVLVRLLDPEDFGLMAMAYLFVTFITNVVDFSVDQAILRETNPDRDFYNSAWTIQILIGAGLAVVTLVMMPAVASYFQDDRVINVLAIIALQPVILGFENIGVVKFRKDMQFNREFKYWTYRKGLGVILTITLALIFRDYHALAIAGPATSLVAVILSYTMSDYRPRFSSRYVKKLWSFSRWMMLTNGSLFGAQRGDAIAMGRLGAADALGIYSVISTVSFMPIQEIFEPLNRALLPGYARFKSSKAELQNVFLEVLGLAFLAVFAIGTGLYCISSDLVLVLLGSKWVDGVDTFAWLALAGACMGLIFVMQDMYTTLHREKDASLIHFAHATTLLVGAFIVGSFLSPKFIAEVRFVIAFIFTVFMVAYLLIRLDVSPTRGLRLIWRPMIASIVMIFVLGRCHGALTGVPAISLICDILLGATTYIVSLAILWLAVGRPGGPESILIARLKILAVERD